MCRCIFCGRIGAPNAHVIPRSQGGLGVEKNIITACSDCHRMLDESEYRQIYLDAAKKHLERFYGAIEADEVAYRKDKDE